MCEAYMVHSLAKLTHPYECSCLAASNGTLFVGTRQGHLFYNLENKELNCELTLVHCNKWYSKKPIQQLEVIPNQDLLLSLSDNIVQLHDIGGNNFSTLQTIQNTKGATVFALNIEKTICLAVVVKKNIQIYYFKKNQFHLLNLITLSDIPKSMAWCQNTICLGYREVYALLQASNREQTEIFPTSSNKSIDPCILLVSNSHFALSRETQTVLVNTSGEIEKNKAVKWTEVPMCLAYDEPYTLGVLTYCIEVRSLESNLSIQTLAGMPKVRFLIQANTGLLFAASLTEIWCVKAVDVAKQREILLDANEFQLALKLTQISNESEEEKKAKSQEIQTLLAYDLFLRKQFDESMREFLKLDINPLEILKLFPVMLGQFPDSTDDLTDKEMQDSIHALRDFLIEIRRKITKPSTSSKQGNGDDRDSKTDDSLKIIDTALLKCYLQTNDALVAPLLRQGRYHVAEIEELLKRKDKHDELVILYQIEGRHRSALELLQSNKRIERTIQYLQDLGKVHLNLILEFSEWVLKEAPHKGIKIFTEDISEVENLPRPEILEYLLKSHPDVAILYLEHVIHIGKEENPSFHNRLIQQYRETIIKNKTGQAEDTRKKLLSFLKTSMHYIAIDVLRDFPTDTLIEERVLILGRLGQHEKAIALLVRALGDIQKAENYCEIFFTKGALADQNIYVILLKVVLKPDSFPLSLPGLNLSLETAQPDLELALQLLQKHASKIDPVEMLASLPDDVPVSKIQHFLSVALQKVVQERRSAQLLEGLMYAEHLQLQDTKLALLNQRVLVTNVNVCPVCKKRFVKHCALVRYPNGDVVHLSCHKKK